MTQNILPFAVVGSEKTIVVGGKQVRGRQNRWGVINGKRTHTSTSQPMALPKITVSIDFS